MKTSRRLKIYSILSLFLFTGCIPTVQDNLDISISIPPFKDLFPSLLERAQEWQADAYLTSSTFPFYSNGSVLHAFFNSPSEALTSMTIDVNRDGTYTIHYYSYPSPRLQYEPIAIDDWMIDSQEALTILLNIQGIRFMSEVESICSNLQLERSMFIESHPVIWILYLSDCSAKPSRFYLDAVSGEILDMPPSVSPTRFFTPTP